MAESQAPEPVEFPMGKYLASSDKKTRDKAVKGLAAVLSNSGTKPLSKYEMAKLWKGLYFCFWMSDKPLVQQALASELADLLLVIPSAEASIQFLGGFWEMMAREWSSIDYLRIDKFYMLVRRFVNAGFRLLDSSGWDSNLAETYDTIMGGPGGPLYPNDTKIPNSLAYHLADIYLEELDKAMAETSARKAPIIRLISPFIKLAALAPQSATYPRIQTALLDPLLTTLSSASTEAERQVKRQRITTSTPPTYSNIISKCVLPTTSKQSLTESEPSSTLDRPVNPSPPTAEDIRNAVLKEIFDVASNEDTRDSSRRKLYALWKAAVADDSKQNRGGEWDAS